MRYALLTTALFALWPAVARADAPVAINQSLPVANPTAVTLEATATATTEMTFAIATSPARGSLGQISTPRCQPTGTGNTDCTATVTYTPNVCTSGPDSFTYTATDTATMATSNPATITLTQGPPPASSPPAPSLAPRDAISAGAQFTATASGAVAGATVDYGDGSGKQPLSVDSAGDAALSHIYAAEGTYTLTVTNPGACATSNSAGERVDVVASGTLGLTSAIAPPGGNATIALGGAIGLEATLTAVPADQSAEILGATYPATSPFFALAAASGQVVAGFDVRAINVSSGDRAVVRFSFPDGGIPTAASVVYFEPGAQRFVAVRPSSLVANSLAIDVLHHQVTIVFDRSSVPSITNLGGTRFAVIAVPPAISGLAVTPRCVARGADRSLRLHLTLSEKAALKIRVRRRAGVRPPARCAGRRTRSVTRAANRTLGLRGRLRPGVYEVTVTARNVHGSSQAITTFAVVR
jgi:PKD repeat protein